MKNFTPQSSIIQELIDDGDREGVLDGDSVEGTVARRGGEMLCGERSLAAGLKRQEQLTRKVANLLLIRGAPLAGANIETY